MIQSFHNDGATLAEHSEQRNRVLFVYAVVFLWRAALEGGAFDEFRAS